jgi:uncharacterized glyoxalase superfamily protein PhnB
LLSRIDPGRRETARLVISRRRCVGSTAAFLVEDVDALHAEFIARGVVISLAPTDQTWGNREMYLDDPDGNKLRFIREGLG